MMERERDLVGYETKARDATYGHMTAPATRLTPASGVMAQADHLLKNVAVAHDLLQRLMLRLEPICEARPEGPQTRDRPSVSEEYSPLGGQLMQANRQLVELHQRLETLTEMLRL